MTRFARPRDTNERSIVLALAAAGASVTKVGDFGTPDLLVGFAGVTVLEEVKNEDTHARRAAGDGLYPGLTPAQVTWWSAPWHGGPRFIVTSVGAALDCLEPCLLTACARCGDIDPMKRKTIYVARTPDGRAWRRESHRRYTHAIAVLHPETGEWYVSCFCAAGLAGEAAAQHRARWAAPVPGLKSYTKVDVRVVDAVVEERIKV